jgi:hypothetical protein
MDEPLAPRRVAVLAAMPNELAPFRRRLRLRRSSLDGRPVYVGTVGATEVVATTTGIGMQRATEVTEHVLRAVRVDQLVVIGIAGGLDPNLTIGQVLVPEVVVDRTTGIGYRPSPPPWLQAKGKLVTCEELLVDKGALTALARDGATAVDMETSSIGAVCEDKGCPWTVFRAISDRVQDELVDDIIGGLAHPDGSPNFTAVARLLVRRPWEVRRLARIAHDAKKAAAAAAEGAVGVCVSA